MKEVHRKNPVHSILSLVVLLGIATLFHSCQLQEEISGNVPPENNRFTTSVVSQPGELDEPMTFTFLDNNEMLIVERKGGVKSFNVQSRQMRKVWTLPVNTIYTNKEGETRAAEEGLLGITSHPDYPEKPWIYMLFADPDEPKHVLARWDYVDGSIVEESKTIVLEYPAQREICCHTGGGMTWDKNKNLYITTGNNTANPPSGTSNLDERPGFESHDDQRTAGNTNDLRGKILRIHPEDDGSYMIPEGNLFPVGTEKTRPEIYTMGHRNPWRISIDSKTGYIFWGEVGPDAGEETPRGPRGYDEFNRAKGPGFFGWPFLIGDNKPYSDYDHITDSVGAPFDASGAVNNSVNNTGLAKLPPAEPALIWYPYTVSEEFPLMGSAGRSATGGPVFRQADFPPSDKRFPAYFEGKWLIVEFMRGWIMAVTLDENGDYQGMEPFLPEENFSSAIDMQFSPDGDLYVLEYGSAWFRGNENAQVKRVQFNGGNRTPIVRASANKMAGALPFEIELSSEGTIDYDEDDLEYEWTIMSNNGFNTRLNEANPTLKLEDAGSYRVTLKVTDEAGNSDRQSFDLLAGNEPPKVDIKIAAGNQSFFFPESQISYEILVTDQEDGEIAKEEISVNFDYTPEGFDPIEIAQNHVATDEWISFSRGQNLIKQSDCFSCHKIDETSIGPSYLAVVEKYEGNPDFWPTLAGRIINGSVGIWGEHAMSAHPNFSQEEAEAIIDYIMTLNDPKQEQESIPLAGVYTTRVPEGQNGKGGFLLRAAYTDHGSGDLKALSSEKIIALRNPQVSFEDNDFEKGTLLLTTPGRSFYINEDGGYVGFRKVDLTGLSELEIKVQASSRSDAAGGVIEVRLGAPDGQLIGQSDMIEPVEIDFRAELGKLIQKWEEGGQQGPRPGWQAVRELFRPKVNIALQDIDGPQDIYFIVRNPNANPGQILLELELVEFKWDGKPLPGRSASM